MNPIMQINGKTITVSEVSGQRVVSYKQIAELHQTKIINLQNNFKRNQHRFIEGTDYFRFKEKSSDTNNLLVSKIVFTESGYLMLVKSLNDDLSWAVQRQLVNGYFRAVVLEQVLAFLPERTKQVLYYRGLGLTQKEVGKLVDMSKDSVKRIEQSLKGLGYQAPNLSGKRSGFPIRSGMTIEEV